MCQKEKTFKSCPSPPGSLWLHVTVNAEPQIYGPCVDALPVLELASQWISAAIGWEEQRFTTTDLALSLKPQTCAATVALK